MLGCIYCICPVYTYTLNAVSMYCTYPVYRPQIDALSYKYRVFSRNAGIDNAGKTRPKSNPGKACTYAYVPWKN